MRELTMQQILESERMTTDILSSKHGKGYVVGVEKDYYVVKDLDTKKIIHVTQPNFDYEMNCNILKEVEADEAIWMIGFNKDTKEYMEF